MKNHFRPTGSKHGSTTCLKHPVGRKNTAPLPACGPTPAWAGQSETKCARNLMRLWASANDLGIGPAVWASHYKFDRAEESRRECAFRLWHIASFLCAAEFGRYPG